MPDLPGSPRIPIGLPKKPGRYGGQELVRLPCVVSRGRNRSHHRCGDLFKILEKSRLGEGSDESCDLCAKLALVETQKLQEMSNGLAKPEFRKWLRESGAVCLPHSQKLLSCAPEALREDIVAATKRREEDLGLRLRELLQKAKAGIPARGGLLGRVAEFLVAQRGLGRDS